MTMSFPVLLTTSGTGSRLGELTKSTNKALISVGGKPAISRIIDAYPQDTEFVVTLGYLGQRVRDFLEREYLGRAITYVWIDRYEGSGASLGYSMLQAKGCLQRPFVFHACDTLVVESIRPPEENWIGGMVVYPGKPLDQYRTHVVQDGAVVKFQDKGALHADSIHIGLVGIKSYVIFWQTLERLYQLSSGDTGLSDVHVLDAMLCQGVPFRWIPYEVWLDTGNPIALAQTEVYLQQRSI